MAKIFGFTSRRELGHDEAEVELPTALEEVVNFIDYAEEISLQLKTLKQFIDDNYSKPEVKAKEAEWKNLVNDFLHFQSQKATRLVMVLARHSKENKLPTLLHQLGRYQTLLMDGGRMRTLKSHDRDEAVKALGGLIQDCRAVQAAPDRS